MGEVALVPSVGGFSANHTRRCYADTPLRPHREVVPRANLAIAATGSPFPIISVLLGGSAFS